MYCKIKTGDVPGDGPVLLMIPDIKLLNKLQIMCEVLGDQSADRKFNSHTIELSSSPSCKANKGQQIKTDNTDVNDAKSNMSDYFRSSINEAANKRAGQVLMQNVHNGFSDVFFSGIGCFQGIFSL